MRGGEEQQPTLPHRNTSSSFPHSSSFRKVDRAAPEERYLILRYVLWIALCLLISVFICVQLYLSTGSRNMEVNVMVTVKSFDLCWS